MRDAIIRKARDCQCYICNNIHIIILNDITLLIIIQIRYEYLITLPPPAVDPSTGRFIKGNGGSLHHCRRRWDLCDAEFLRYKHMNAWDRAMQHLDKAFGFITAPHQWVSKKDEGDKLVVVERGDLVFVFNFHPEKSFTGEICIFNTSVRCNLIGLTLIYFVIIMIVIVIVFL